MQPKDKIFVAKLGKTVGLKGQLKLHIDSDFPEQFKKNAQFITNKNQTLIVESFNKNNNVIKFFDIDDINSAKKYINQELFSDIQNTKKLCKLDKNQYFWFDLIDSFVVEDDQVLGQIKDIQRYPLGDYFEIATYEKLINEQSLPKIFLLPYLDSYILDVDIPNKTIKVQNAFDILKAS